MDIHRCRFVDYNPSAINALAFSHPLPSNPRSTRIPSTLRLAIGRANGSIEIWNPLQNWMHECTLQGGKDRSIEGLAWLQEPNTSIPGGYISRLFSIGNSTYVTEWDLTTGKPLAQFDANKGIVWSIAARPARVVKKGEEEVDEDELGPRLVVGCSDGSLVLISTAGGRGNMSFVRVLSHSAKARVLSLAYQTSDLIVAGMSDSRLRVFDTTMNRVVATMGVGHDRRSKDVLIWSVKCLQVGNGGPGGYIVAGDSRGEVTFFDGKRYTMMQRIKGHDADVLAIETNGKGTRVLSTGIDRKTVLYELTGSGGAGGQGKGRKRWFEVSGRRFHKHDVRAMAAFESGNMSVAVSGGVDAAPIIIPFQTFGKEFHRSLPLIPQMPVITTAPRSRLVVAHFDREVKIWHIDEQNTYNFEDDIFKSRNDAKKLVGRVMLNNAEHIVASAISPSGDILAISTLASIKLFHLRPKKSVPNALRVTKIPLDDEITNMGARALKFSPQGDWLCYISPKSDVYQIKITLSDALDSLENAVGKPQKLKRKDKDIEKPRNAKVPVCDGVAGLGRGYERMIHRIAFSANGIILAASDLGGWTQCWKLDDGKWSKIKAQLPRLLGPAVAIGFRPGRPTFTSPQGQLAVENEISSMELVSPSLNKSSSLQLLHQQHQQLSGDGADAPPNLFVLTSSHTLHEFNVLEGSLTPWSKRNPSENLPFDFTQVMDRASGMTFTNDAVKGQRIWLWGATWVWMFNIDRDIPRTKKTDDDTNSKGAGAHKRKREGQPLKTSGAGQLIPQENREGGAVAFQNQPPKVIVGRSEVKSKRKVQKMDLDSDEEAFLVNKHTASRPGHGHSQKSNQKLKVESESDSDSDSSSSSSSSESDSDGSSSGSGSDSDSDSSSDSDTSSSDSDSEASEKEEMDIDEAPVPKALLPPPPAQVESKQQVEIHGKDDISENKTSGPPIWHTYNYRPLMAFLPISDKSNGLEMLVVERPVWDIPFPPRFREKRDRV